MEDSLENLRHGRAAHLVYDTRFFVEWPEFLGGGRAEADFYGAMTLIPMLVT